MGMMYAVATSCTQPMIRKQLSKRKIHEHDTCPRCRGFRTLMRSSWSDGTDGNAILIKRQTGRARYPTALGTVHFGCCRSSAIHRLRKLFLDTYSNEQSTPIKSVSVPTKYHPR